MPELLIRVVDKVNPDDPYLNLRIMKRGDVITAQPDGWPWGYDERTLPFWRIVIVPSLSMAFAQTLLSAELPESPTDTGRTLQRRAFKIDLDNSPFSRFEGVAAYLADASRLQPSLTLLGLLPAIAIELSKRRKPHLPDPQEIGSSLSVIG